MEDEPLALRGFALGLIDHVGDGMEHLGEPLAGDRRDGQRP
jgi:hypothetical protein